MAGHEAKPGKHFGDTHTKKSTLVRKSDYRANTATGYKRGTWQAHHIICEHAIGSRKFSDDETKEFGERCLWVTDWNLNDSPNMIGMPIRGDIRREDGIKDTNICSHANDHNTSGGYTDECKDYMKSKVWDKVKKGKPGHTTTPEDLSGALNAASAHFRIQLAKRASRKDGTMVAWTKRHEPAQAARWYIPFSMAKNGAVVPRLPGAPSNIAASMTNVFKRIV